MRQLAFDLPALGSNLRSFVVARYLTDFVPSPCPAWDPDPEALAKITIRWPKRYEWDGASEWVEVLKMGLRQYVRLEVADDIAQPYKGTVVFEVVNGSKTHKMAIGYSDYLPIDEDCADNSDLYFKMQFDERGYGRPNVVPGGYVPDGKRLYFYLRKLRSLRDKQNYCFDVHGRFSLNYAPEIRQKAIGRLSSQRKFGFEGGSTTVSYRDFLKEVAQSRICIDLPGLGPLCFRLMNYLAVGTCVIAYPHESILHVPLVDREHIVYCKKISDLLELCEYYLGNDDERERIARNARDFFDKYLHKDNLVRYYLHKFLQVTS